LTSFNNKGGPEPPVKTKVVNANSEARLKAALKLKIRVLPSQTKLSTSISIVDAKVPGDTSISGWENNNEIINISNIGTAQQQ
jgi:hypothetical protein